MGAMVTEAGESHISLKLENLGDQITDLKDLIMREITDLKNEQIADLRKQDDRLAEDQRRAWEAIRSLESDRNLSHGKGKVIGHIYTAAIAMITSSGAAVMFAKFFK